MGCGASTLVPSTTGEPAPLRVSAGFAPDETSDSAQVSAFSEDASSPMRADEATSQPEAKPPWEWDVLDTSGSPVKSALDRGPGPQAASSAALGTAPHRLPLPPLGAAGPGRLPPVAKLGGPIVLDKPSAGGLKHLGAPQAPRPLMPLGSINVNVSAGEGGEGMQPLSAGRKPLPAVVPPAPKMLAPPTASAGLAGRSNKWQPAAGAPGTDAPPKALLSTPPTPASGQATAVEAVETGDEVAALAAVRPPSSPAPAEASAQPGQQRGSKPKRRLSWAEASPKVVSFEKVEQSPVVDYKANMLALQELRRARVREGKVALSFRSLVAELDISEGGEALSVLAGMDAGLPTNSAPYAAGAAAPVTMMRGGFTWGQLAAAQAVQAS